MAPQRTPGLLFATCATLLACLAQTSAGCDKSTADMPVNTAPSPNASILPAPLASQAQPAAEVPPFPGAAPSATTPDPPRSTGPDGGSSPAQAMRSDEPLADDPLTQREVAGISLQSEWRYAEVPGPPRAPDVNLGALDLARKLTLPRVTVDLASVGRMRMIFDSRAMPLARGSEVRARADHYGHAVVWPGGSHYRVLPSGGLRSLFAESRADAVPLVRPQSSGKLEGPRRLGYLTRKWELSTRAGSMVLEQARIPGAGEGGVLLCRFLAEVLTIDPSAAPCGFDDVPLRAQFNWPEGGSVTFEVTRVADKVDLAAAELLVPPPLAQFLPGDLPLAPRVTLDRDDLAAFRTRPSEATPGAAAGDGLLLRNGTDLLRYVFIDGVPVAWAWPAQDTAVLGLVRGRYVLQWRSFLADTLDPPVAIEVPGRASLGLERDR
jgi:hypothetical protein